MFEHVYLSIKNIVIMEKTILIEIRNVYGAQNIYVISEHKQFIQNLTGKKTIDHSDIISLKGLGFSIEEPAKPSIKY